MTNTTTLKNRVHKMYKQSPIHNQSPIKYDQIQPCVEYGIKKTCLYVFLILVGKLVQKYKKNLYEMKVRVNIMVHHYKMDNQSQIQFDKSSPVLKMV